MEIEISNAEVRDQTRFENAPSLERLCFRCRCVEAASTRLEIGIELALLFLVPVSFLVIGLQYSQ